MNGTLTKSGGSFKIDNPLDPANRYLQHSFVESPDMKNIYDGVLRTDRRGYATVRLPRYFGALNRSFRYQLTTIRSFSRAIVWREISDNRFVWDGMVLEPLSFIQAGDRLAVEMRMVARGSRSGAPVDFMGWHVWELEGGAAVRMQSHTQREGALTAAGLVVP